MIPGHAGHCAEHEDADAQDVDRVLDAADAERGGIEVVGAIAHDVPQLADEPVDAGRAVGEADEQHAALLAGEVSDPRSVLLDERALQDEHSTGSALQAEVDRQPTDADHSQRRGRTHRRGEIGGRST